MLLLGTVVKRALGLRKTLQKARRSAPAHTVQQRTLVKLIRKARKTEFGKHFGFREILNSEEIEKEFRKRVPISDYDSMHKDWWHLSLQEKKGVCWPGKIKYFALSSGTGNASSKQIPVTQSMLRSMRKTGIRQLLTLINYPFPEDFYGKGVLVLGGSSELTRVGHYYQGDLSGINQAKMPFYTRPFYKPGRTIAKVKDWHLKIDEIVKKAPSWDIVMLTGVPAWNQIVLEKIIDYYNLKHIHEIWPNLSVFIYGGVALAPYKKSFDPLLGKPIHYLQTYLASEGFIAFQSRPNTEGMELVLNNGLYFEFIPFNGKNFTPDGQLKDNVDCVCIKNVKEKTDYALVLSSNAGAWRYLIGDTVRFSNVMQNEIVITGRIQQFLSLCGEHLSLDNMTRAVAQLSESENLPIPEFTVAGVSLDNAFAHHWFLGISTEIPESIQIVNKLDQILCGLNDDYALEREHLLREIKVWLIPASVFFKWMEFKGKLGGQHKFPRVLNSERHQEWLTFLKSENVML